MAQGPERTARSAPTHSAAFGTGLMAIASVLFAAMAVLTRSVSGQMSSGQLVVIRFSIGLVGVAAIFAWRRQGPRMPRPGMLAMRGLLGGASVYCYFVAIERLGVGPATLLNYSSPVYAAPFAFLFLGERPRAHLWVGLGVASVGACLVAYSTVDPSRPFHLGVGAWAGLASSVLSGAAMTGIRSLRKDTDATTIFMSFCVFGGLIALPFALRAWTPMTPALWVPAIGVGVLSLLAQLVFTYAFGFVTAAAGSATTQLTPALSWLMAILFLREQAKALTFLGALLCFAGVLWGATAGATRPQRL